MAGEEFGDVTNINKGANKGEVIEGEGINYPEEVLAILALKDPKLEINIEEINEILETYRDKFDAIKIHENKFLLLGFKKCHAILDKSDGATESFNSSHTVEGFDNLLKIEDNYNNSISFLNTELKSSISFERDKTSYEKVEGFDNLLKIEDNYNNSISFLNTELKSSILFERDKTSYEKVEGFDNLLKIEDNYNNSISFLNTELKSSISFRRDKTSYKKVEGFDNLLKIEDNYNNSISFLNTELKSSISFRRDKTSYKKVEGFDNLLIIEEKNNNTMGVDTYFLNADLNCIDGFNHVVRYEKVEGFDNLLEITKIGSGEKKLFNKDLKRTGRIYYDHYKDGYLYSPAGTRKKINLETMEIDDYWQLDENTNK